MKKLFWLVVASVLLLAGCATVPMAPLEEDQARKAFSAPSQGTSAVYIFRNSSYGSALKRMLFIDGQLIGATAPMTYFYKEVQPGDHTLSTESEFGNNDLMLKAESGKNYYIRQYIKMGVFVGGSNLEAVSEEDGRKGVLDCKLAR